MVQSSNEYMTEVITRITSQLGLKEFERDLVLNVHGLVNSPAPMDKLSAIRRMESIDSAKADLINVMYMVNDMYLTRRDEYRRSLESGISLESHSTGSKYTSRTIIESHVYSSSPLLNDQRMLLDNFENFKILLGMYSKSLDSAKDTCIRSLSNY